VDGDGSVEVLAQTTADPKWQIHVLSGATGQTISRISGESSAPYPFLVVDVNNDAKVELFESSGGDTNRQIISFQNGAASPQVIANNMPNMARMPVISNMNSDQFKEILYAEESNPGVLKVVNPYTWTIANSFAITSANYYPNVIVDDILTSFTGDEIVSSWTGGFLALHRVGDAPSYPITQQWLRSVPGVGYFGAAILVAPNLDGTGDREIVWSYYSSSLDRWVTEVVRASDGQLLYSINDRRICTLRGRPGFPGWKDGRVMGYVNLDIDLADEIILCESYTSAGVITSLVAYDWDSTSNTLVTKWSIAGAVPQLDNQLPSIYPNTLQYFPNFAADFDKNGVFDVLVNQAGALKALDGTTGLPIYTYTLPVSMSVQYIGNLDSDPSTTEVLLSGADGYLYYLDRTLNLQRRMYAGVGFAQPYVVDTNGDQKNEVIFVDARNRLLNLNTVTATLEIPPVLHWSWGAALPFNWHPVNLDNAGPWEYIVVDSSQFPTFTLRLITKDLDGTESLLGSGSIPNATGWPAMFGVGQFNGASTPYDIFVVTGDGVDSVSRVLLWTGSSFVPSWSLSNLAHVAQPAAIGDANNDTIDDIAMMNFVFPYVFNGLDGSVIGGDSSPLDLVAQPIIANLDGDDAQEVLFASAADGSFRVAEFAPSLPTAFTRQIPGSQSATAAVADVSLSEPGLEIVYRTQNGVLGTMSGINGRKIKKE
jgi:hypothetical protein